MILTELQLFNPDGTLTLSPSEWAPNGVRDADKVATRVIYALLTLQGSIPSQPSSGCAFTSLVQSFRSEFDVFAAFAASLSAIVATVQSAQSASEPDSELLGTVSLAGVTISSDVLMLTLNVTALDGSSPSNPVLAVVPT